jgi:hypothetical protein
MTVQQYKPTPDGATIMRIVDGVVRDWIPNAPGNGDHTRYLADVAADPSMLLQADPPLPAPKSLIQEVKVEDFRTTNGTISTLASWPLAVQTLYTARFTLMAIDVGNADCRVWTAKATAKRVNNGALLVGTPTLETSHADAGADTAIRSIKH